MLLRRPSRLGTTWIHTSNERPSHKHANLGCLCFCGSLHRLRLCTSHETSNNRGNTHRQGSILTHDAQQRSQSSRLLRRQQSFRRQRISKFMRRHGTRTHPLSSRRPPLKRSFRKEDSRTNATCKKKILHAKRHWPVMITTMLWPFALKCAADRLNKCSQNKDVFFT